jgi:hypothetical protein
MSRKFFDVLRRYEEMLTYMSGMARATQREAWQGGPERERMRCARALDELATAWTYEQQDLMTLQQLNQRCLEQYEQGELDAGDFTVRDIQEFLAQLRERVIASTTRPTS